MKNIIIIKNYMNSKNPKLKIVFEDDELTKEEQIKFIFQLLDLIVNGRCFV